MKFQGVTVFAVVFILCIVVQGWIWNTRWLVDQDSWIQATEAAAQGALPSEGDFLFGYPATTILLPAGALTSATGDAGFSLRLVMVALLSLASAAAATLAYALRPKSLWWLVLGWTLAFSPLYILSTPPSSFLGPLAALFVLAALYVSRKETISAPSLLLLGALGGVMLATRLELSVFIIAPLALYLATRKAAALYLIPLSAAAVFAALDPSLWQAGSVAHLSGIFAKVLGHAEASIFISNPLESAFYASKFGIVGFALAALLLFFRKLRSLPCRFTAWLLTGTGLAFLGLSIAQHHPTWMFFPILFVWEAVLPLLAGDAYDALPVNGTLRKRVSRAAFLRVAALLYCLYYAGYFFLEVSWF